MPLSGLDDDELADLTASQVAVDGRAVTSAVSARLREQTAGNPLYATQLVRHWTESGRLILDAGITLAQNESEEVPASLRNLLWSRGRALGDDVLEVLSTAAVLGTKFAEDAVIEMVEISERDALRSIVAERARLVVDVGPSTKTMRFVHVLAASAVYAEHHLSRAFEIVDAFGWDYHRATTLIFLAVCRRRRLGRLDRRAHASLDHAQRICSTHGLSRLLDTIEELRG